MTKKQRHKQKVPDIGNFSRKTEKSEGVSAVKSFVESFSGAPGSMATSGEDSIAPEKNEPNDPKEEQTVEEVSDEISKLESDIESVQEAPEMTYKERLSEIGLELEDAEEVIDAMMVKGEFRKTYPLTSKYAVTFKSRKLEDQNRALDVIEAKNPQFPSTVGNIVSECNLAASIVKFNDIDFSDDMKITEKIKWARNLPDTVASLLASKLAKFDQMLMTVLEEGAIENF